MDNIKIMRNMVSVVDEKRKSRKFPLSDTEFVKINNVSKQLGFKKPRDLMVYLCCGENSFIEKMAVNIPVRQHRKSGRRETVCPGLRKLLMRVYSRNVLSKP